MLVNFIPGIRGARGIRGPPLSRRNGSFNFGVETELVLLSPCRNLTDFSSRGPAAPSTTLLLLIRPLLVSFTERKKGKVANNVSGDRRHYSADNWVTGGVRGIWE